MAAVHPRVAGRAHPVWLRTASWCTTLVFTVLSIGSPLGARPQRGASGGYPPKTPPANARALAPLANALLAYDDLVRANRGKPPDDAAQRIADLQRLAPSAKAEIRAFLGRLRQARETDAFDAYVYRQADKSGRPTLSSEIRGAGGPTAVLSRADTLIDQLIAERRKASTPENPADRLAESFGLTVALSAGVLSTVCGAFWFTLSLGYGDAVAYRSCYY